MCKCIRTKIVAKDMPISLDTTECTIPSHAFRNSSGTLNRSSPLYQCLG